ncbi:MAG: GNAT family N-acetyltransferase [Actinomycetota bacterium]
MPLALPIVGIGFIIREFQASDAEPIAEIEFDPTVKRYLALPEGSKRDWIEQVRRLGLYGWIVQSEDGQIAGSASLNRAKRKGDAELRLVIGRQSWGMSLGSKVARRLVQVAFEDLSAKAIVAVVHPDNQASLRLVRSLRFRRRDVVREPAPPWQVGHYIYRLTRRAYNSSLCSDMPDGQ